MQKHLHILYTEQQTYHSLSKSQGEKQAYFVVEKTLLVSAQK